jgi:ABC-type sugar transport system substrate-binding protein
MTKRVLVLAAALAVFVAALGGGTSAGKTAQRDITLAFIPAVLANPAQQAIDKGLKNQAKKLGFTAVTLGGEFNPQAQIVAMNAAIQRRVDAIAIWPLDPKGIRPSLDRARRAGIAIFTLWSPQTTGVVANFQYAEAPAARRMARMAAARVKQQGKDCNVGIIQGIPVVTILDARNRGFESGARSAGCRILEKQINDKDSADGARPIAEAWKTKWGSEMTVLLTYNDPSALGAISTFSGSFRPLVASINADPAALQAIRAGTMLATSTIPNAEVGNAIAYAAHQHLVRKQRVPKQLVAGVDILTRANVGRYVPWEVRNRRAMSVRFVRQGGQWRIKTTPDYSLTR